MRNICLIVLAALLMSLPIQAQSTFASIVGTVTDPSGGMIPGAVITVLDLDKNTTRTAESGSSGYFEVLNLTPGKYQVTASKEGFTTSQFASITLDARQTIRADFHLLIATAQQTVVVTEAASAINTENATIAETKTFEEITLLPVNYRGQTTSPLAAISTVPGVAQDDSGNIALSGGLPAQVEYSLDGISTASVRYSGPVSDMYPSSEMLGEFRVTEVNNNAEFAQMGDVTVSTKSGSNALHGSSFWYAQNAALDAITYGSSEKQAKVFNTFGGSLSGPVYIPGLYRGRNRTFFFVDYEGNRRPGSTFLQYSVPTAAMWAGDLSNLPGPQVVDPETGLPFPDNTIPAERISAVATALSNYYPSVTDNSGTTLNNYRKLYSTPSTTDGYDIRIDHNLTSKQQIFGRWSWKNISYSAQDAAFLPADQFSIASRNLVLSHNLLISSSLLNEFRFGMSLWTLKDIFPLEGSAVVSNLGLVGLDLTNTPVGTGGFPGFDFSDGTGFTSLSHARDGDTKSTNYQYSDNLSWSKGHHTMKFGVDIRSLGYTDVAHFGGADDFGTLTFNSNAFSGNAFADLLLGLPASSSHFVIGANTSQHAYHYNVYAQDEWRVTNRMTASYGLRYEVNPSMTETNGNITNFNPLNGEVIMPDHGIAASAGFLAGINACPGDPAYPCTKIVTASEAGLPQSLRKTYFGNWNPRIGIAYRPFGDTSTVIRAGFGAFTQTPLGPEAYALSGVASGDSRSYTNFQGAGQAPTFTLPNVGNDTSEYAAIGTESFYTASAINYRDPVSYQWNLTAEKKFKGITVARMSYIGSHSARLMGLEDVNQVPASTTPYSHDLVPFPNWFVIAESNNLLFASYNALQAEVTHNQSNGLFYQASYTFARNIGNVGGASGGWNGATMPGEADFAFITDKYNPGRDRGNIGGTQAQNFLLTAMHELPIGRGHRFGANVNRLTDTVLGGWKLSTVTLLQSGTWLTPTMSSSLDQSNTDMVDRGIPARPDRIGSGKPAHRTRDNYFDIDAFAPTAEGCGCFGNSGVGILQGPGAVAIAGGLSKQFEITKGLHMRLEGTFTNLLNHPNFEPPSMDISSAVDFGVLTTVKSQQNTGNRSGQISARFDF